MLEWKIENNNKEVIILIMKCKNGKNGKKWMNNSGKVIKKLREFDHEVEVHYQVVLEMMIMMNIV